MICLMYFSLNVGSIWALDAPDQNKYPAPSNILQDVSSRGSHIVASELYLDFEKWNYILKNIADGSEIWLKVADALNSESDAAISEMLSYAVGEALENEPLNVFRFAIPSFNLKLICSGPDIDDYRYNSYTKAMDTIIQRQKKISELHAPDIKPMCEKCIQMLEESKEGVASFYGIKNEK